MRPELRQLRSALVHPAVLLGVLAVLAGAWAVLAVRPGAAPRFERVELSPPLEPKLEPAEVRLWTFDAEGLERPVLAQLPLPEAPAARLEAIVAALRSELGPSGRWPAALPAPRVFLVEEDRVRTAVVDLRPEGPVALDVTGERRLYRALVATLEENGADRVAFLRNGAPDGVFLEHLRVPSGL